MKPTLHGGLIAASLSLFLAAPATAHGGRYRGPQDIVPPGTKGHTPKTPTPITPGGLPGVPVPTTPTTPSPAPMGRPSTPTGPPPGGRGNPTTGRGRGLGEDLTRWQIWWDFNKDGYLMLKDALFQGRPVTGDDSIYIGAFRRKEELPTLRPSDSQIGDVILPDLKRALDTTGNRDITSSCLMALAKIGRDQRKFQLLPTLARYLPSHDQEIRETAALAMGVSQMPAAVPDLVALSLDQPHGRKLVQHTAVDNRTRSFAAYGLGLIAHSTGDLETKRQVLAAMSTILDDNSIFDRNIRVAAIQAISLLNPGQASDAGVRLLDDALGILTRFYDRKLGRGEELLQSHVPTAIAKLLGRGRTPLHKRHKVRFVAALDPRKRRSNDIQRSAALALGQMSLATESEYSRALLNYYHRGRDTQARNFSLIALAQIGGNENRIALLKELAQGSKAIEKPWAALALGVLSWELRKQDGERAALDTVGHALLNEFEKARTPYAKSAMAVALGLTGHREAGRALRNELARKKHQGEYAGFLCIGMSLMPYKKARQDILAIVRSSVHRPDLMRQAATALGKMGDRNVTRVLLEMLQDKGEVNLAKMAAIAGALSFIGDRTTVAPLREMLFDTQLTPLTRAFAAVALGGVADQSSLPWNYKIACNLNYRAAVETLTQSGTGVLDIL
jgi:HEAT repeat protein